MDTCVTLSDERYRAFIENINDGVYELDGNGNFTYFNDALSKILGHPKDEIQRQNLAKFMDKKHARIAHSSFIKIWVTHKGFSDLVWRIIQKNGQVRIIELSAYLIVNEKGKKEGFRGIVRDITEKINSKEALQACEQRYQIEHRASRRAQKWARNLLDFVPYPMIVFSLGGKVNYLNPSFTETFGWSLKELRKKSIPFIPPGLQEETIENYEKLLDGKIILRHKSKRLTKDGLILDVILRGAVYSGEEGQPEGLLVCLRDITQEKKMMRNNEALLRISTALPAYPDLEELLDYISTVIKELLNTEGAVVTLLDEEKNELFFQGAAYDDKTTQKRAKETRFPADKGVSGRVIKTGKPVIVPELSEDSDYYPGVSQKIKTHVHDMLVVPLRSSDRIIGVLLATNKKEGTFEDTDIEMLSVIAGAVALYIENTRFSEEVKKAYKEVTSLNRAKDKAINHLSHELMTPASILLASLSTLSKRLRKTDEETWEPTMERAKRNLERIFEIQYQVNDIMQGKQLKTYNLLTLLLDQCSDELEALVADEVGEIPIIERIRKRIKDIFGPKDSIVSEIRLDRHVQESLKELKPRISHRQVEITPHIESVPSTCIPSDVLQKVVDGLIKNAIENTPDEGKITVTVKKKGAGAELVVHDCGVGITAANQMRIFEGFFSTQETIAYSSKRPYDFNAGGKGADLLRMKIFSERYNFEIELDSTRCCFIPKESDICPGRISECGFCKNKNDCYESGGTIATVFFPLSR